MPKEATFHLWLIFLTNSILFQNGKTQVFNTEQRRIPPSLRPIHTERKRKFSLTHVVCSLIFLLVHWSFSLSLLLSLGVIMPLRVSFSLTRNVKRDYWYVRPWSHLPSTFTSMAASQCINGDTNTNTENGSEPILCINICITIDAMLNFDSDANADVKCEQALKSKTSTS